MSTDYRALCAELLAALDAQALRDPEMDGGLLRREARLALAHAEPVDLAPVPCDLPVPTPPSWRSKRGYSVAVETTYGTPPANLNDVPVVKEVYLLQQPPEYGKSAIRVESSIRVEGTFEYGGMTYRYETDAFPTTTDTP